MFNLIGIVLLVFAIFFFGMGVIVSTKQPDTVKITNTETNIYERIEVGVNERISEGKAKKLGYERGEFIEEPSGELISGNVIGNDFKNAVKTTNRQRLSEQGENKTDRLNQPLRDDNQTERLNTSSIGKTDRLNNSGIRDDKTDRLNAITGQQDKTARLNNPNEDKTERLKEPKDGLVQDKTDRLNNEREQTDRLEQVAIKKNDTHERTERLSNYDTERNETDRLPNKKTDQLKKSEEKKEKPKQVYQDKTDRLIKTEDKTERLVVKKNEKQPEPSSKKEKHADKTDRLGVIVLNESTQNDNDEFLNSKLDEVYEYQNTIEIQDAPMQDEEEIFYSDPLGIRLFDDEE